MKGAFEDFTLLNQFLILRNRFNFDKVFETGTYEGQSARRLCEFVETVHTVEIEWDKYEKVKKRFNGKFHNIICHWGHSPYILYEVLKDNEKGWCFFLDAHTPADPLLDELTVLARRRPIDPVILIHDFDNKQWMLNDINEFMMKIYSSDYTHYVVDKNLDPEIMSPTGVYYP